MLLCTVTAPTRHTCLLGPTLSQGVLLCLCALYAARYALVFSADWCHILPCTACAALYCLYHLCHQVGASQKLACVIDGESLMNDGSALVIFLLLQKIVEGEPVTVGGVSEAARCLAVTSLDTSSDMTNLHTRLYNLHDLGWFMQYVSAGVRIDHVISFDHVIR